jgi:hypothetical protein
MENLLKTFNNIISESNNQINDKLTGINYLEKLKYILIDELKKLKTSELKDIQNFEISKNYRNRHLLIRFSKNPETLSKINNLISDDCLSIVLFGSKSIKLHENEKPKDSHSLSLFSLTGIVMTKNSILSEVFSKDSTILDIYNISLDNNVEK